jgi:hypothetical protein
MILMSVVDFTNERERERCTRVVREALASRRPRVYTLTTYGRGETDHVRIFVADGGKIHELTYYVARAVGNAQLSPGKGWAFRGGGYSKGLEAFDWACRIAGVSVDQSKWSEL